MAENKKGFVLYCDLIHTVKKMSASDAGELFLHILEYVNDEDPETDNLTVDLIFEHIKQQLKRDLRKYEARAERSRSNGAKGGRPKKEPKKPSGLIKNPGEPKKPVIVTVTDKDTVTVNDIIKQVEKTRQGVFIEWLNYRKEIKKPVKNPSTLKKLINKFNSEPLSKCQWVVNHSIENTYQGLIWDKYSNNGNTTAETRQERIDRESQERTERLVAKLHEENNDNPEHGSNSL